MSTKRFYNRRDAVEVGLLLGLIIGVAIGYTKGDMGFWLIGAMAAGACIGAVCSSLFPNE